jgi:hypothetical protein
MENWIDARAIDIAGYRPRLLGRTDDTALEGFLSRMEGLIAFSKPRGLRLRPLVEAEDRAAVEPLVLECALETARVDADLLHTLGHLAGLPGTPDTRMTGKVRFTAPHGLEQLPAKVVVEGTAFSTLAAADGTFELGGLPPGRYRLGFMAPGSQIRSRTVRVGASPVTLTVTLPASRPGNLVRNPSFRQRWVDAGAPDAWYPSGGEWEGEIVPVQPGGTYRLSVRWRPRAAGEVLLRWWDGPSPGLHRRSDAGTLAAGVPGRTFTAPATATFAQVVVRSTGPPNKVCRDLAFAPAATRSE